MTLVVQQIVVFVLCVSAALFATWRLMSARQRLSLLESLARRVSADSVPGRWLTSQVQRYRLAAQSSGCSTCARKPPGA
jgi:hypothetical protein